jgi:hypothetical protein
MIRNRTFARSVAIAGSAALVFGTAPFTSSIGATLKRELTPADALATVRIMDNQTVPGSAIDHAATSPDGRRYVLRLARGDVGRNGVWLDLLTGSLDSLEAAAHPKVCAHLFTTGLGSTRNSQGADFDAHPSNVFRWIGNREIAFLWSGRHRVRQVIAVDLERCKVRTLTHSPTTVFSFGVAADGTILINAQAPSSSESARRLWSEGFTVRDSSDGWSILAGNIGGGDIADSGDNSQWFIQSPSGAVKHIPFNEASIDRTTPVFRGIYLSPDGRYALTSAGGPADPDHWKRYTNDFLQTLLNYDAAARTRSPLNYALIDLRQGSSRLLWDAPKTSRSQVAWSPSSDAALLAPTFLPVDSSDAAGLDGAAAVVIDIVTGHYQVVPLDLRSRAVTGLHWFGPDGIEIRSNGSGGADARRQRFHRSAGNWQEVADGGDSAVAARIQIETRQSLNSPPRVFAVDRKSGRSRLILDSNPGLLERFKLGRVERRSGDLGNGRQWLGQLIYPADYVPGRRYPLVIQSTYGRTFDSEEFSLDGTWGASGMGLGPSDFAAYPGQLLATRNIAVLQLQVLHNGQGIDEAPDRQHAFEAVADELAASGLVDRDKVALDGFSRNGYFVEYTLSHSTFPFAAAIAADNYDPSYFQSALGNWRNDDALLNGAPAFGDGLMEWLKHAPGFNAEHIHTPLRMIGQSAGMPLIMAKWEIYSRLRALHRPVEFYMMPNADQYPSHTPQNPRQIMAIQEGAIDWFSFWLTGREDGAPEKRLQYARWHALRDLPRTLNP